MKEALKEFVRELAPAEASAELPDDTLILSAGLKSVQLVLLVVKIRKAFGVTLEMEDLVANPTLARMAEILEERRNAAATAAGVNPQPTIGIK